MKGWEKDHTVIFRPIEKADYEDLSNTIVKTWGFDEISDDPAFKRHTGHIYLESCLIKQTYNCVAVVDGKAAGIIAGSNLRKKRKNVKYIMGVIWHMLCLLLNGGFRKNMSKLKGYQETARQMEKELGDSFEAEVALFILDEKCRGIGIGKQLYDNLMRYFDDAGIKSFYLQTDNACSYGFYERQGLRRLAERKTEISYAGVNNVEMYMYGRESSLHKE